MKKMGKTMPRPRKILVIRLRTSLGPAAGAAAYLKTLESISEILTNAALVAEMVPPNFVLFHNVRAIVTDEVGILCRAAMLARKLGIPAIVGTSTTTRKLSESLHAVVDAFSGEVYKIND